MNPNGVPVLMIHGALENGLIFYTESGKGLACYLAEQGFDVYVADLRGRGQSTPLINKDSAHGQYESINEDLPAFIDYIHAKTKQTMHVVSHSWGGVLVASCLVRYPSRIAQVRSNICFGTKRTITVKNIEKFVKINVMWNLVAPIIARAKGFLDAKKYNLGSDNETRGSIKHSIAWVNKGHWIDPLDGFNYQQASKQITWPATLHITGINDHVLGHIDDVTLFIEESNNHKAHVLLLSQSNGNAIDYGHIDILTHPLAISDHFPDVVNWINEFT